MKAILEFELPLDNCQHYQAIEGHKAFSVLDEFKRHLRSLDKHGDFEEKSGEKVFQEIYDKFYEIISEEGISNESFY